jgi:hypothetical protein
MRSIRGGQGQAGQNLSRRFLLGVSAVSAGAFTLDRALGKSTDGKADDAPSQKPIEYGSTICPLQCIMIYNGIYYYAAYNCDDHQGSTMTSSVQFDALGCPQQGQTPNSSCLVGRPRWYGSGVDNSDTARHSVNGNCTNPKDPHYHKFAKADLAQPCLLIAGQGTVISGPTDYTISYTGPSSAKSYIIRTFLVLCTPTVGTEQNPATPVLMGIGQELAGVPSSLGSATFKVDVPAAPQGMELRHYMHLMRTKDRVHFHVLVEENRP